MDAQRARNIPRSSERISGSTPLAAYALLTPTDRPWAIFAACDAVALGVLETARLAHIRVPQELSVIGFDDSYAALGAPPQLSTIRQPLIDMGRLALRTALAASTGEPTHLRWG